MSAASPGGEAGSDPNEAYVAKYTATKVRTFKMNYRRIFGLKLSCFVTIDPSTFEVTNTFDYADVKKLKPKDGDADAFSFTCSKNGAMEWKSEFRNQLLTEFVRLRGMRLDDATLGLPAPFGCERIKRNSLREPGCLLVRPHALCETAPDGTVISEYRFLQVAAVQDAAEDPTVLVLHVAGRARVWAVNPANGGKANLVAKMKEQAALIGLDLKQGPPTSIEQVQVERAKYGTGTGVPLATYAVSKVTRRHPSMPVGRKLTVTDEWLVERDAATFKVVSARPLSSVFSIVRPWGEPRAFQIEFDDNAARSYESGERDMVIGSLLDAVHRSGNRRVEVSARGSSDGLRLTPRFYTEEVKKTGFFKEAFFGPDTIEGWHLNQLAAKAGALTTLEPTKKDVKGGYVVTGSVGTDASEGFTELMQAAAAFNANVPVTGCEPNTDKDKVVKACGPLLAILNTLGGHTERAPDVAAIRTLAGHTVTLLQSLMRLALTTQAMKLMPALPMGPTTDVSTILLRLLKSREPFVAYWATLVLAVPLKHPLQGGLRNSKQEYENKQAMLSNQLNVALVSLLNDNRVALLVKKSREGNHVEDKEGEDEGDENSSNSSNTSKNNTGGASSALSIMAVSGLLESVLCSCRDTTSPERFDALLHVLAQEFQSLMAMLRSPCALIMENATLLMMTIHEHAPALAADLRDVAMSEAVLLRHLYLAMFSPSVDQRFVSRHLCTLWMDGNLESPQKRLLARIVPSGLIEYLKMPALSVAEADNLDFLEAEESEFSAYEKRPDGQAGGVKKGFGAMARLKERIADLAALKQAEADSGGPPVNAGFENFRVMFHTATRDHKLPDLIWNQQTRRELRASLESELASFDTAVRDNGLGNIAWNHQQFEVHYPSLASEVRVGKTYLKDFLEGGPSFVQHFDNPQRFFDLLMRRVLVHSATQPELAAMCCQCLERLYHYHGANLGVFDDTFVLMDLIGAATHRPARHRLLTLVQELCLRDENTEQVLNDFSVALLTDVAAFAHTNPKSIGSKLQRAVTKTYGASAMLTNGGVDDDAATASDAAAANGGGAGGGEGGEGGEPAEEVAKDETLTEKFDEDDSIAPRTWYVAPGNLGVPPPPNKIRGPYRVSELRAFVKDGHLSASSLVCAGFVESYVDEDGAELQLDTGHWRTLESVRQLKWQLLSEGVLPVSPAKHARSALATLRRMVTMHKCADTRGIAYHPIPFGKRVVSKPESLAVLAQLMLANEPEVVEEAADLLHDVLDHNPTASAKLYTTGLFHFAMAYTGSNFGIVSRLLHATHLRQAFRDSANAVASTLPLWKRSVLGESVPEAMVWILENYGPERFAEVFVGTFDTPEVIWNTEMRTHLIASVHHHLGDFPLQLKQHNGGAYKYCPLPTVTYANLAKEVFCHNFYLRSITDTVRFPNWPIPDPIAFLKALLERWKLELSKEASEGQASVKEACAVLEIKGSSFEDGELRKNYRALARKYHPDRNPYGRDQFEEIQKAYEVLTLALTEAKARGNVAVSRVDVQEVGGTDDEKVLLLVASQVMLCERFPGEIGEYKYPAYPLLFRCMEAHAPPPPGTPYKELDGKNLVACAKLAYASCLISPQNAEELITEGGIAVMHDALCKCLKRVDSLTSPSASKELVAVGWLAHSLSGLAHFETARQAMVPFADSIAVCVATLLTLPQSAQLAQFALEATSRMAKDPILQKSLVCAGVLWRAIPKLLHFDVSHELQQKASIEAAARKVAAAREAGEKWEALSADASVAEAKASAAARYRDELGKGKGSMLAEADAAAEAAATEAAAAREAAEAAAAEARRANAEEQEAATEAAAAAAAGNEKSNSSGGEGKDGDEAKDGANEANSSPLAAYEPGANSSSSDAAIAAAQRATQAATPAAVNLEARLAARAVGALAGQLLRDQIATAPMPEVQVALRYLLTPQLAKLLRNARPEELLLALNQNTLTATKIWTLEMRDELVAKVAKVLKERPCGDRAVQSLEDELAPALTYGFTRLGKELQVGGVYLKFYIATPEEASIDHPDKFADALLGALCTTDLPPPNNKYPSHDPDTMLILGRVHECVPHPSGGSPQDANHDCSQVCAALETLLASDAGARDVVCDHGAGTVLSLLESPVTGAPFGHAVTMLTSLASYKPFAAMVAAQPSCLWRLIKRLAGAKEPPCPASAWAVADAICSTHDVVNAALQSGIFLLLLATLAGHPDLSPALAGRAGCCSILQRCLRDPIAGPSVTAALDHFLPCSIIDSLRASTDPKAVLETFDGEAETPARVWNAAMRKVLRKFVAGQLESYRASGEPDGHPWVLTHEIQVVYPELEAELVVGGIYLKHFLKDPTFDLSDPLAFLEQLLLKWFADMDQQLSESGLAAIVAAAQAATAASQAGKDPQEGDPSSSSDAGSGALVAREVDETLSVVTSAIVYLLKVRLPLCDQLAHWGYAPRLVGLMKQAIDAGALGTPLVSSLRLIHQIGERPLCIEVLAASTQNLISQLVHLLVPDLHPDTAFVVETMLRLFKFGAGGSAHGYENLVAAALGAQLPNVLMDQVLENPKLQTEVVDPAATKVHGVELLKVLSVDPAFGMEFAAALDRIEAWAKYKNQNHGLFLTDDQKVDYFLTDGNSDEPMLLTWHGKKNTMAGANATTLRLMASAEGVAKVHAAKSNPPATGTDADAAAAAAPAVPPPVPPAPAAVAAVPPPVPPAPAAAAAVPPPVPPAPAAAAAPPPVPLAPAAAAVPPPVPPAPAAAAVPPPVPPAPAAAVPPPVPPAPAAAAAAAVPPPVPPAPAAAAAPPPVPPAPVAAAAPPPVPAAPAAAAAPPPVPPAPTAATATGAKRIAIQMVKEGGSLGADLKDLEGRVLVKGLKELPPGTRHPAKTADPPLEVGDVVVLVNGEQYSNFKDCVSKIRGAGDNVTLTVERA